MINKIRLLTTFKELVTIDSPSGEEQELAQDITARLKRLEGEIMLDNYGNVIAKFSGVGEAIMLNAHLDTVEPGRGITVISKGARIYSDKKTILGADPKAGIAIILEAIQSLRENKQTHRPIEVIFTREEETTSDGIKSLNFSQISAKHCLVFDGDGSVANIFISSPAYYRFDGKITGKSAHAGIEPEKGLSAIEIAAKLLGAIKLGKIDQETTINVGTIQGGTARNIIPEMVRFTGEIRSRDNKKLKRIISKIDKVFGAISDAYPNAVIEKELVKEFDGFILLPRDKFVKNVITTIKAMGITPLLKDAMGASDANFIAAEGISPIVLGTGAYNIHTTDECLITEEMLQAARFCERFLVS